MPLNKVTKPNQTPLWLKYICLKIIYIWLDCVQEKSQTLYSLGQWETGVQSQVESY